ncbi:hypothetical protein BV22DRAFT_684439 [Leucogyrophana mollusca]|uniref:Uncharacterized protein n=1 Tax=Leucogyrophana mollusca TaxID=85980 RepID=A0ACB8B8F2_9AGAM|nr:hypothetical protein BV22DRAFT_684439 [Leucogyrophana mollusca]
MLRGHRIATRNMRRLSTPCLRSTLRIALCPVRRPSQSCVAAAVAQAWVDSVSGSYRECRIKRACHEHRLT